MLQKQVPLIATDDQENGKMISMAFALVLVHY
jgi:hypothetical protein